MNGNLNLYHIFYAVAKCGNISSAARELFISQPAVSKAVSSLERSLNTILFTRSSKGVSLTPEGKILYTHVEEAFLSLSFGEEQLCQMQNLGVGEISIGVSATLCKYVLLPYLQNFIRSNPHIRVSISCQSTYRTLQSLQNGSIDLGLIGEPEKDTHIFFQPVAEIEDIFVTTKSYLENLNTRTPVSSFSSAADNAAFLMLDRENMTRQYIDNCLKAENIYLKQIIEVSSMDLLIDFAKIDLGIACVIKNFIKKELADSTLIPFPLAHSIPRRRIGFACRAPRNMAVRKFMDCCL